jgi:hypothetical protein
MLNNYNTDFHFASNYNPFSTDGNSFPSHSNFVIDLKTTNNEEITHKSINHVPDLTNSWKFSDINDTTSEEVDGDGVATEPLPCSSPTKIALPPQNATHETMKKTVQYNIY